jgi:hypothetical protein
MRQIFVEHLTDISGICDIHMRLIFVEHVTDICGICDRYLWNI